MALPFEPSGRLWDVPLHLVQINLKGRVDSERKGMLESLRGHVDSFFFSFKLLLVFFNGRTEDVHN